jgi:hypothetical protein
MARVLDKFTFPVFGGGAKESRPWQEWQDGKIRELKHGTDFTCKVQTIAMQARSKAKKANLKVRVSMDKAAGTVVLQFYKPTEREQVAKEPVASVTPLTKGKGKRK